MSGRPEHVKCIASGPDRFSPALCARPRLAFDWLFVDVAHARRSVEQEDRLQPCEACLAVAKDGGS